MLSFRAVISRLRAVTFSSDSVSAISHARGHLSVSRFAGQTKEKRETARSLSDFVLLNFVSADSHITSGRNQKFVSLLLISSSSRPNLLCFGFDLN